MAPSTICRDAFGGDPGGAVAIFDLEEFQGVVVFGGCGVEPGHYLHDVAGPYSADERDGLGLSALERSGEFVAMETQAPGRREHLPPGLRGNPVFGVASAQDERDGGPSDSGRLGYFRHRDAMGHLDWLLANRC
jgi:hypothetical protein